MWLSRALLCGLWAFLSGTIISQSFCTQIHSFSFRIFSHSSYFPAFLSLPLCHSYDFPPAHGDRLTDSRCTADVHLGPFTSGQTHHLPSLRMFLSIYFSQKKYFCDKSLIKHQKNSFPYVTVLKVRLLLLLLLLEVDLSTRRTPACPDSFIRHSTDVVRPLFFLLNLCLCLGRLVAKWQNVSRSTDWKYPSGRDEWRDPDKARSER